MTYMLLCVCIDRVASCNNLYANEKHMLLEEPPVAYEVQQWNSQQ